MTFNQFCIQEFVPFDTIHLFRLWLGSTAKCKLPRVEWYRLWKEFAQ